MVNDSLRWGVEYRRLSSQSIFGWGFTLSRGKAGEEAQFEVFLEGDFFTFLGILSIIFLTLFV